MLAFGLPDYLPGKRAFAAQLLFYHGLVSVVFLQANPSILNVALPDWLTALLPAVEFPLTKAIGILHGVLALLISGWWQDTVPTVQRAQQQSASAK